MAGKDRTTRIQPVIWPIHPFPARMATSIALEELRNSGRPLRVLDPMVGSGTTLVIAKSQGHHAVGFDTDPMAVLLATTWCLDVHEDAARQTAAHVLQRAIAVGKKLKPSDAYPCSEEDRETRTFIRYWFDSTNRRQLTALSRAVQRVKDDGIQTLLWCAFSRMIITKQASVSLAMDLAHSRPHRVRDWSDIHPFDRFLSSVEAVIRAAPFKNKNGLGKVDVKLGDARRLPQRSTSIDLVITSPPYLNAIDYLRGHKFSLVWMGHRISDLRGIRATSIGTEAAGAGDPVDPTISSALREMGNVNLLPRRYIRMLARYVADMQSVIQQIARVLIPGGRAVLVIGDSTLRGLYVKNSRAVACLAQRQGLVLSSVRHRTIPDSRRYLPPPSVPYGGNLRARMRKEVVLAFSSP